LERKGDKMARPKHHRISVKTERKEIRRLEAEKRALTEQEQKARRRVRHPVPT